MIQEKRRLEEKKEEVEATKKKMRVEDSGDNVGANKEHDGGGDGDGKRRSDVRNVESEIRTLKGLIPGLSEDGNIGEVSRSFCCSLTPPSKKKCFGPNSTRDMCYFSRRFLVLAEMKVVQSGVIKVD